MAILRGGPASGLLIPDDSKDVEWVATTSNSAGAPIPEQPTPGHALRLPRTAEAATDLLLDQPRRRWECYRRVGATIPDLVIDPVDDLPITDVITYRWVSGRQP